MNKLSKYIFLVTFIVIVMTGCREEESDPVSFFTTETVTKTLNNEDVYFIFTNTSMTSNAPVSPSVQSSISSGKSLLESKKLDINDQWIENTSQSEILNKIAEFNKKELFSKSTLSRSLTAPLLQSPTYQTIPGNDVAGVTEDTFYLDPDDTSQSIDATCQAVITDGDISLSIWVADSEWLSTISSEMVTTIANSFLSSSGDDIYKWVTDIYGVPWGSHNNPSLINETYANHLTILLYDVDGDSTDVFDNGGIVGYFWPKDNYSSSYVFNDGTSVSGSNERVMFYIDSYFLSRIDETLGDSSTWSIDNYWPKEVISTLAHEFQHMIHFYQKQIKLDAKYSDTWLDEMCSLVTEDLVADKLNISGPRGTGESDTLYDYTAGVTQITNCRLSDFNYANNESFLIWNTDQNVYYDYAAAYAFGAFLSRNYGGAALFQDIVQSPLSDENAVVSAVNNLNGTNKTFVDLLIEWGKAVLTSDLTSVDYSYNNGGKFESSPTNPTGTDYAIGSINLFNYSTYIPTWNDYLDGPVIYNGNISNSISSAVLAPATNTFYRAGRNLSGTHTWTVEVPDDVILTVVVK